jgi:iron-sulfur cluster assembly protein
MTTKTEFNMELTTKAEKFVRRMMRFSPSSRSGFRLKVRPGGCSGLAVEFDLVPKSGADEIVWDYAELHFFLDDISMQLLNGSIVDFIDSRTHTGFVIATPGEAAKACSPESSMVSVGSLTRR